MTKVNITTGINAHCRLADLSIGDYFIDPDGDLCVFIGDLTWGDMEHVNIFCLSNGSCYNYSEGKMVTPIKAININLEY